jgi:DNA-binding CsgD family transcriptional regulator
MPSVVGRDAELAVVTEVLASSGPHATGLVIVGEPGIGKSTVWEEAVRLAREGGRRVLATRPTESEAKLSFSGLADLLSAVPADAVATLPSPQQAALDAALLRIEVSQPPNRRLLGTAFASVLRALAEEDDVAVAVDDVQWLDAPSSAVVEFALRRLGDAPVRLMLSMRSGTTSPLGRTVPDDRMRRVALGPLSVAALHRIFVDRLGRTFPRPGLVRIAQASGGNPFYALEIGRLVDGRPGSSSLPVPAEVLSLVKRRIRSLPADSRGALLRVAAAARPDLGLVDAGPLAAGEEAGLVEVASDGRIAFVHPLYASAVYASAPLAQRREAHRDLAERVRDPEERARHLALACPGTDDEVAGIVEGAARVAQARGAPDGAAELTELALRLTPAGSAARDERRLALASYLELAGDFDRARGLVEDVVATGPAGDLRARALLLLTGLVYRRAGETAASAVAREAVAAATDPVLRARCQAVLAGMAGTVDVAGAASAAREAVEALEHAGAEPAILSFALANLVRADLFAGHGFDASAAQRAFDLERSTPPAAVDDRVAYKLGQWLRYTDDYDGARRHLADADTAAQEEGDESSFVNIRLNRLLLELWAGRWRDAEEAAVSLSETAEQLGIPQAGTVWRAYLDAYLGRLDEVRAIAAAADRNEPIVDMLHLRSLGVVELAAGLYEDANAHLRVAVEILDRSGTREPAIWRVDGEAIEAAIAAGELDRAEALTARLEEHAARSRIPWSVAVSLRSRGLMLAANGDLDGAVAALEAALLAQEGPFEHARTQLALGQVRRRRKEKRLARAALEAALSVFEDLGATLWAQRTGEQLRRVTTRKAPETLTETEREVARLAAGGLTNKAIAERVFVSRKTVEANLARAYRKLGITSRAQLARALDADAAETIS